MEIVRKHVAFYPEYSHGSWQKGACTDKECQEVSYTVPVKACGPVTFRWRVFPGEDADASLSYQGANPTLDESAYPLYAVIDDDSHFIDSPALGKQVPSVCQLKK